MEETYEIQNHIDLLPEELLENIFARLPIGDLLLTHSTVCKHWYETIHSPYFLPWKKLYINLKMKRKLLISSVLLGPLKHKKKSSVDDIVQGIVDTHELGVLRTFLPNVIKFMGTHRSMCTFKECCEKLKHHRLVNLAVELLDWLPENLIGKPYNSWHLVATIVIISKDVWDIYNILNLLFCNPFPLCATEVIEAFYSLATIFLYGVRELDLPMRYHYYVYYALYTFENSWKPPKIKDQQAHSYQHSGQQSLNSYLTSTLKLTHEQARIVNHDIQKHHVVKIVAFAGTGKTTTLLQFCRERPHLNFLLVVYNKSVQEHCQKIFPSNTKVKTAHAMAYAAVGRRYASIKKLDGNLKPMKISDLLHKKKNSGHRYKRAGLVKRTLEHFFNSASPYITLQHVPQEDSRGNKLPDDYRLDIILDDAEEIWKKMTMLSASQKINMTQDGQLKEWQLNKPKLYGYDVIMIDEGQDMNPAMFDIFLGQETAKVIVGDPHQQIYAFRGATNAIQSINATHTFHLTQSFRFGPEIAFMGQTILENVLELSTKTLVGGSTRDSIFFNPADELNRVQRAYLCRSNCGLYILALSICKNKKFDNKRLSFSGGIDKVGLEDILDIMKLDQVSKGFETPESLEIKNRFISRFESVATLFSYAEAVEDQELMNKISMFRYSGNRVAQDIQLLRSRFNYSTNLADIVLSTIHKAKGLEWDWVILADDMMPDGLQVAMKSGREDLKAEINLLYVASTRAKKRLTINIPLLHAINYGGEKLERLTCRSKVPPDTKCLQCGAACLSGDNKSQPSPLITEVSTLPLSCEGFKLSGGYICDKCAAIPVFELAQNPRRLNNFLSSFYVKDNERVARLVFLTGNAEEQSEEDNLAHSKRIRCDEYVGVRA